jgi:propionate CoA-transferase
VSFEKEAANLEALSLAMAARASGGKVIVQVERIAQKGSLHPRSVVIPSVLVDALVLPLSPEEHTQTASQMYNPSFSGELRTSFPDILDSPSDARRVICRRATMEIKKGDIINIGIGIPVGVVYESYKRGIFNDIMMTIEMGVFGGQPAPIPDFGASWNPEAIVSHPSMFDFYHGGGLTVTFVGAGQVDREGNINVSKMGDCVVGPGGFIDITQSTKKVVVCATFTTKNREIKAKRGLLEIIREGEVRKFVRNCGPDNF